MKNDYVLMEYYTRYLREVRHLSDSSIKHYLGALRSISRYLVNKERIENTIYEIQDIGELEVIKTYLYQEPEFIALDKKGHQMYSAGMNNYIKFAMGTEFTGIKNKIKLLDIEIPVGKKVLINNEKWQRSSIIKMQTIEAVDYECEIETSHTTFTAKSTGKQYMEGHHAIPINLQERFEKSLDVYANVVCVCPTCHRLLHYGIESEKQIVLNKIYYERAERLASSGIKVSHDEFMAIAM